jgi:hypothetical protein
VITDHRYDAGWPRDDSEGCIAEVPTGVADKTYADCGQPEAQHAHSEYPSQRPARDDQWYPEDVGAMHEPAPYLGELDWPELVHPFVD